MHIRRRWYTVCPMKSTSPDVELLSSPPEPNADDLVMRAYSALRERILDGDLEPGRPLRQATLSQSIGVSRTPLREALRLLAVEGLVELRSRRGAVVADLSPGDMSAAWQARLVLEPGAARLAAMRGDSESLRAMREAIDEQRRRADEPRAAFDSNRLFHLALVQAAGNPYLMRTAELLWVRRIGISIYDTQRISSRRVSTFADEHEAIADAVAAGDTELALSLIHISEPTRPY